jgi:hypothetical protein
VTCPLRRAPRPAFVLIELQPEQPITGELKIEPQVVPGRVVSDPQLHVLGLSKRREVRAEQA